ncbi:MAG TPA: response regulator [Tepidisphaeraceae bacterium]|jgi:CheY-like chemotaxis protein|nr:response regulator [Tepidisphaeraceae bacterium]
MMDVGNPEHPPPSRPWRLLLCDDSSLERAALSHYLRDQGYEVEEAADGEAGLSQLKNRQVDLIVLDLHMPGIDGFDVLAYLQEHRPGLPVILLSGMPADDIQPRIHRLPKHELPPLLIKPVEPIQILNLIEASLAGELPIR